MIRKQTDDRGEKLAPSFDKISNGMRKKKRQDMIFAYAVLIFPVIHFIVFWLCMNVSTVFLSFRSGNMQVGEWNNFRNYTGAFRAIFGIDKNEGMIMNWRALLNTLSLIPLSMFINLPITLVFSFAIFRKIKGYTIYQIVLFLPAMISATVLCFVFKMFINGNQAVFNKLLEAMNLEKIIPANNWLGDKHTAWSSMLVFSVWTGISTNIIYFGSSMARVPESIIESVQLDGASEMTIFNKIVLPILMPTICTMSISIVSGCFAWYMPSLLIDSNNQYITSLALIVITNTKSNNIGLASAWGVIIGVLGMVFITVFRKVLAKFSEEVEF